MLGFEDPEAIRSQGHHRPITVIVCGTDIEIPSSSASLKQLLQTSWIHPQKFAALPLLKVTFDDTAFNRLIVDLSNQTPDSPTQIIITSRSIFPLLNSDTPVGKAILNRSASIELGGVGPETTGHLEREWGHLVKIMPRREDYGLAPMLLDFENQNRSSGGSSTQLLILGSQSGLSQNLFRSFLDRNPSAKVQFYACYATGLNQAAGEIFLKFMSAAQADGHDVVLVVRSGQMLLALTAMIENLEKNMPDLKFPETQLLLWGDSTYKALDEVTLPSWLYS